VAKIKQTGAAVTNMMLGMIGLKRNVVKEAKVGNVISIGTDGEEIESINLTNLSEPFMTARKNIVEDIASGAPMPAKMLTDESFAQGFADGTEDANEQARYIDGEREQMQPLYEFLDELCMRRAWNPDWYANLQKQYPTQFGKMPFERAFFMFKESFDAQWPSLLKEPESEQVHVADVKLRALIAVLQVYMPKLDPENLVIVAKFVNDNINEMKQMFSSPLNFNYDTWEDHLAKEPEEGEEPKTPAPFSAADSAAKAIEALMRASDDLSRIVSERRARGMRHLEDANK
jgi:hypothetical protein